MSLFIDVFLKELQPHLDKFTSYLDETITTGIDLTQPVGSVAVTPSSHHHPHHAHHHHTPSSSSLINLELPILKESLLLNTTLYPWFFKTHKRHQSAIGEICKLIGTSHRLYEFTVSSLSSLYARTHDWFYSTLKSQILIKLAEMHNNETLMAIVGAVATGEQSSSDAAQCEMVFKFSSLINACLREKKIEAKRAKELETIMESKKFDKILP